MIVVTKLAEEIETVKCQPASQIQTGDIETIWGVSRPVEFRDTTKFINYFRLWKHNKSIEKT